MLLQHFYTGLDNESAQHLNITSGGSFAHLTPAEGREILDKTLDRTSFIYVPEPTSAKPEVRHEEVPLIESEQLESQSIDSTPEPSPELKSETPEEEDPHPLEFLQNFEEDLFKDYGNISNYSYQRRPQVPITPLDTSEKEYLHETLKGMTIMMSDEWLKEGELSSKPI